LAEPTEIKETAEVGTRIERGSETNRAPSKHQKRIPAKNSAGASERGKNKTRKETAQEEAGQRGLFSPQGRAGSGTAWQLPRWPWRRRRRRTETSKGRRRALLAQMRVPVRKE